jgi:outer membrane receptor protein involved in Fe transport
MKIIHRLVAVTVLILISVPLVANAGTTGKITGKIIDKETNEPLPGVNIVVKGTSLGGTTNLDGYYVILAVPPGNQTITASMVGYAPVTVIDVAVRIDQTSTVDIQLTTEAIQTQGVEVVATRDVVRKDLSASVSTVASAEIRSLPVTTLTDVVGLQAGVDNGMVIRGGSADQLLLQVDGFTQRDPRNNLPITNIALSSVQDVSIEKGGFNAEYGQVRSGLLNIVEKEGSSSRYTASINLKYGSPQQKYFGNSVYDPNSYYNRPYLDPAVCWTGTSNGAWSTYTQQQYPSFEGWNAYSKQLLAQGIDLSPAAAKRLYEWQHRQQPDTKSPDYNIDGSFGGPVPIIGGSLGNLRFLASFVTNRTMLLVPLSRPDYRDYNGAIKLNSDINAGTKLELKASRGQSYNVAINATDNGMFNQSYLVQAPGTYPFWAPTDFMQTPDQIAGVVSDYADRARTSTVYSPSWYSTSDVSDYVLSGKLTRFINSDTYYELSFNNVNRNYHTGPTALRDTSTLYELIPGYYVDEAPFGYSPTYTLGSHEGQNPDPQLFFGGHGATSADSSKAHSYEFKGDLSSQINETNLIKVGLGFSYYDLNLNYGTNNRQTTDVSWVKEKWNPYSLSAYAQDKIEAYGFIANLGVRMDLSSPNTDWVQVNPFDAAFFSSQYTSTASYSAERVKPSVTFSPRLGISHPITATSKLYFNYGHFQQLPTYEEMLRVGRSATNAMINYGNPGLRQAETVSYQLGFDQSLLDQYLFQVALFYNDNSDQQAFTWYVSNSQGIAYYGANNNSYSDVRGVEITLSKNYGEWIQGFINYTYQEMSLGQFGQTFQSDNPVQQRAFIENPPNGSLYQLARQRPVAQPRANASLTFLLPRNFGPDVLGVKPLSEWSINLLGTWKAGPWLTYNPQGVSGLAYNVQETDYADIGLRINKTFSFGNTFAVTLFVEATNVLNAKRLSGESFSDAPTDFTNYMGSLHLPSNPGYDNTNIPGSDRVGDYRLNGAAYQPVLFSGNVQGINVNASSFDATAIYWDKPTGRYMQYTNGSWQQVEQSHMQKILNDKAYIDMPNISAFDFLNPRQFYFGLNLSF